MINTVTQTEFVDWFRSSDTYKNNFSYEGLLALFDYLEEIENCEGEQIEFDPIAICCDFSEYADLQDIKDSYDCINDMDDLYMHTSVIKVENIDGTESDRLIIQEF